MRFDLTDIPTRTVVKFAVIYSLSQLAAMALIALLLYLL